MCAAIAYIAAPCHAQQADRMMVESRAAEVVAEREAKARNLQPDNLQPIERTLNVIKEKRIVERITGGIAGVRVRFGGLVTGSGFAIGPEYFLRSPREDVVFRTSARGSLKKFYLLDMGLSFPRLAHDHAFVDLYAARRDYPRLEYYGPGPNSSKAGRTAYRWEDTSFEVRGGVKPFEHLRIGAIGRYMFLNIGPTTDERFASTERVYSPAAAPGVLQQSNYMTGGGFVQFDWRDNPGGPRMGGNYIAQYTLWSDRTFGIGSFERFDAEAQQYIPFFNSRRVIALRGRTTFTDPRRGQFVPFYLQPHLGGSDDLRGFRPFRFHDFNSLVMNAEYRWEVFSGLDMALFADAGKVFPNAHDISLADLEKSYGFGFRFNVRNDVFFRIDTGFSREGFQVWFKFDNVF